MPRYARDVEAEITFTPTGEGGRESPVRSGYRPQFYYDGHGWDAVHTYEGKEWVYPGQTAKAYLSFLRPQCHVGRLYPGKEFLLREGTRVVGRGRIIKVLELEESAKEMLAEEGKRV
jgi:translation elongation factor EF-Tu-like GTPase